MNEYTVEKSTVECYKLRMPDGMYYADITIDCEGKAGRISIASDFGNWSTYWGSAGPSFKEFLLEINMDYFASKVGEDNKLNFERTIFGYKRLIRELRREENIGQQTAREMYDALDDMEEFDTEEAFCNEMYRHKALHELIDGYPDVITEVGIGFRRFWDGPWKIFKEEIKKELQWATETT